jgi:hypothetical protein
MITTTTMTTQGKYGTTVHRLTLMATNGKYEKTISPTILPFTMTKHKVKLVMKK